MYLRLFPAKLGGLALALATSVVAAGLLPVRVCAQTNWTVAITEGTAPNLKFSVSWDTPNGNKPCNYANTQSNPASATSAGNIWVCQRDTVYWNVTTATQQSALVISFTKKIFSSGPPDFRTGYGQNPTANGQMPNRNTSPEAYITVVDNGTFYYSDPKIKISTGSAPLERYVLDLRNDICEGRESESTETKLEKSLNNLVNELKRDGFVVNLKACKK